MFMVVFLGCRGIPARQAISTEDARTVMTVKEHP